jgi:ribosome maturation factor RimP
MDDSAATATFPETFERSVAGLTGDPELADVEIVMTTLRPGRTSELTVMIDRKGGVDIGTVERIAARVNGALDAFPDTMYTLEVTSAGLERPLVQPADYDRFAQRNVKIVTTTLIAQAKTHRGVLLGKRGDDVILRTGAKGEVELTIPLAAIKSANLEYDPRADLQRAKREKKAP